MLFILDNNKKYIRKSSNVQLTVWVSLQGVFRSKNLLNPEVVFLALAVADVLTAEDGTSGFWALDSL